MKTEDFDDAIRKKVNSIYHTYKEDDIDKIHGYVNQKRASALKMRWAKTVGVAAAAVVMAGSLIWNIDQFRDKKELSQRIDTLENTLAKSPKIILKTDTVYLEKSTENNNKIADVKTSTPENNDLNKTNSGTEQNLAADYNKTAGKNASENIKNPLGKDNAVEKSAQQNRNNNGRNNLTVNDEKSKNNTDRNLADNKIKNKSGNENPAANSGSANGNNSSQKDAQVKTNELTKTIEPNDSAYVINEKNALDSAETIEKQIAENKENAPENVHSAEEKTKKKPSFSPKQFHYNVGISLERANHQAGFGLVGQVFFTDRIGLNTGVKLLTFGEDRFRNPREFNERERRDFCEVCGPEFKEDTANIENIQRRTSIMQIPVSITYMLPLKNAFSLNFSAGTDIDLGAKQRIDFDHRKPGAPRERQDLMVNAPVSTFNNAVFSVGLQKSIGNFALQVNPFISPQLKKVEYKKDPVYFGANFKALYNF